ncbi:hypothetical protein HDU97_000263 [Phlyctochytrium planicorne]|nr:hypothetical protein HDU97_000263 [Phlyctochytrium planicorne]
MPNYLIVGGGTFGLSTAYALRQRGHEVTVFDRFRIPAEDAASTDINKVVRADYADDVLYQELGLKAIEKFKEWNPDAIKRFGRPLYTECGATFMTAKPEMNTFEKECIKGLSNAGLGDALVPLSGSSAPPLSKWPGLEAARTQLKGGYLNTKAGFGESGLTIKYLAALATEAGVKFVTGSKGTFSELIKIKTKVRGFKSLDGTHHWGTVVIAAGSWTPSILPEIAKICTPVGQAVVQFKIPEELKKTFSPDSFPVWFGDVTQMGFYGFPMTCDGIVKVAHHGKGYPSTGPESYHVTKGKTEKTPPEIPLAAVLRYRDFFSTHFPMLNHLDIFKTRVCWYCDSFDGNFVVDAVPGFSNLFVASGGSGHAFKFTPVIGEVVADVVEGKENQYTGLFGWREPDAGKVDSIRADGEVGLGLHEEVKCVPEDLKAETYRNGVLRRKVENMKAKL